MFRRLLGPALLVLLSVSLLISQTAASRPAITGVAMISLRTSNLEKARQFYGRDLGFAEPYTLQGEAGPPVACFKVNDHQYIRVEESLRDEGDRLIHILFETADAKRLRSYLAARRFAVPDEVKTDADGNLSFLVRDGENHEVGFVQYLSTSKQGRAKGKSLPETRISEHMIHTGFLAGSQATLDSFYRDLLGFDEMWHGGKTDTVADWIDMRVPDGDDWLEYMLNVHNPSAKTRGVMNHLALGVPSVDAAYKRLIERGVALGEKPKIGRDGKWQLNLYDPDLTRVELMEPKPVEKPCCSEFKTR